MHKREQPPRFMSASSLHRIFTEYQLVCLQKPLKAITIRILCALLAP